MSFRASNLVAGLVVSFAAALASLADAAPPFDAKAFTDWMTARMNAAYRLPTEAEREYATRAIDAGFDLRVDPALRIFMYLPFEHSETLADQDRTVALCEALGDASYLKYAHAHRDVICRFGRFPHRNRALARVNTPEEQTWLDAGGGF